MENNDSSVFDNDDSRRSGADESSVKDANASPEKPLDSWSKIADELNAASDVHSDWNGESSSSPSTRQTQNDYVFGESSTSDGIEWDGGAAWKSTRQTSESSFDDKKKIDEDYETRSRNRTRSVWNHGEWSEPERGGAQSYKTGEGNGYSRERNDDFNDNYRRSGYRQDNRGGYRTDGRPNFRRERGSYEQGGSGPRRRTSFENGSYRESGFKGPRRESNPRTDMQRDGSRADNYRNGGQRTNDRKYGRFENQGDYRRNLNGRQRRYGAEFVDNAQPNDENRYSGRRNYKGSNRDDSISDRYPNNYKNSYYDLNQRRRSRYGRHENYEPTIGALGKRGEPLSLAEELAARRHRRTALEKYGSDSLQNEGVFGTEGSTSTQNSDESKTVSYGDRMPLGIVELEKLTMQELVAEARRQNLETVDGEQRRDLIVRVLRAKIQQNGMLFGGGTLEILPDEFGFLRSPEARYLSCPDDIYISPSQIRRFGLRNGLTISGQIRPPKERERYFALLCVESINGENPNALASKPFFDDLVDARPVKQLKLESSDNVDCSLQKSETSEASATQIRRNRLNLRAIDLVAPIAFGQRALLVYSDRSEKSALIREIVKSIVGANVDASAFVVMIDQRPEEIAEMEDGLSGTRCEVVGSTFDEPSIRHIQLSEIVFEKAKRMVEYGQNVVVVLDSLTRLAHAWNAERASAGIGLIDSFDTLALQRPKKLFSSARYIEGGGSLTIIATAALGDDNSFDQTALEEFRAVENAEFWLNRVSPDNPKPISIDVVKSHARDVRDFIPQENYASYCELLERLKAKSPEEAESFLGGKLEETSDNAALYASLKTNDA